MTYYVSYVKESEPFESLVRGHGGPKGNPYRTRW